MSPNSSNVSDSPVSVVLAVDDDITVQSMLSEYLRRWGYEPLTASSGKEALQIISERKPDLVLTDIVMEPVSGLDLLYRVKRDHPEIDVVMFTGHCSEDVIIDALRGGAVDFLKKPFSMDSLETVVRKALRMKKGKGGAALDPFFVNEETKRLVLPNDPNLIEGAVEQLTQNARCCISMERSRELAVALYELILNAMEHGNLCITRQEKTEHLDRGDYLDLLNARGNNPELAKRRVTIDYRLNDTGLFYDIRDEGAGFDWADSCRFSGDVVECLSTHGRGLILAGFYVDKLHFNDEGNAARLTMFADEIRGRTSS